MAIEAKTKKICREQFEFYMGHLFFNREGNGRKASLPFPGDEPENPVIRRPDGKLFCTKCGCIVPNTANAEMRKEGFYSYSHVCSASTEGAETQAEEAAEVNTNSYDTVWIIASRIAESKPEIIRGIVISTESEKIVVKEKISPLTDNLYVFEKDGWDSIFRTEEEAREVLYGDGEKGAAWKIKHGLNPQWKPEEGKN